jgi:hypothetical protein
MKIFLDEQLHVNLKIYLSSFNVFEPKDFDWQGLKNGELREKLNDKKFDIFITTDKNIPFQQNFQKINFCIFLIDVPTSKWEHLSLFVPKIQSLLQNLPPLLPKLIVITLNDISPLRKNEALKILLPSDQILFI